MLFEREGNGSDTNIYYMCLDCARWTTTVTSPITYNEIMQILELACIMDAPKDVLNHKFIMFLSDMYCCDFFIINTSNGLIIFSSVHGIGPQHSCSLIML
jgi:hypothetical protein